MRSVLALAPWSRRRGSKWRRPSVRVRTASSGRQARRESTTCAILGCRALPCGSGSPRCRPSRTEHKAVIDAFKQLEKEGFEVTWLKPGADGIVRPEQVREALRPETQLVSIMHVNNETGVIQDVAADRRDLSRARHRVPCGCRAERRQVAAQRRDDEHRPAVDHGAQDLRTEGHRCALHPSSAAAGIAAVVIWRRSGNWACARARCRRIKSSAWVRRSK